MLVLEEGFGVGDSGMRGHHFLDLSLLPPMSLRETMMG